MTSRAAPARPHRVSKIVVCCALVLAACSEDSSPLRVVPLEPAASRLVGGTGQVGMVGERVPDSLTVLVTDRFGNPVPQADVAFVVADGGGTVQPALAQTDLDGIARAVWVLGTVAGVHTVRAELPGVEPVLFTVTATPGPPATLAREGGNGQASTAGSRLAPLVVRVTDVYDNPVSGVTVAWSVASGGGSVNPATSITDEAGMAFTSLTLGPTPGPNRVIARVDGLPDAVFEATALDPQNLRIAAAYLVQATQTLAGDVPLIAGRDALLRIFVVSTQPTGLRADVRVDLYRGGALVATHTLSAPTSGAPTAVEEGSLARSWNLPIPGDMIAPGLAILATVDPDDDVVEADENDNTFPASGTPLALDVRTLPPFDVRFIPVRITGATTVTGNVSPGDAGRYLEDALKVFPLPGADAAVRAPFTSSVSTTNSADAWNAIINEIRALRTTEGSRSYYYGVLPNAGGSPYCGLGFVGFPVAIGLDVCGSWTAAHEWGHNFGRLHVPCGNPGGPDPNYPYPNGSIGVYGFDPATGELKRPATHVDLMSYCSPEWISDYTFRAVLAYREAEPDGQAAFAVAPEPTLVVWGRMDGRSLTLEPAFEVETRPALPAEAGPYTLQGLDAAGAVVFELSFAGEALGDGAPDARQFAFAVPVSLAQPQRLERLRLVGPGAPPAEIARPPIAARAQAQAAPALEALAAREVRMRWDAGGFPLAVARDPRTGDVLAFARGGTALLHTDAAELELIVSDGIRSTRQRVSVQR